MGVGVGKGGVGWDVNVRFKLHIHTDETLLRCHTMRATESGVGVGVGKGGVGWDVNVRFNESCFINGLNGPEDSFFK